MTATDCVRNDLQQSTVGSGPVFGSIAASIGWVWYNEPYVREDWHVSLVAGLIILGGIAARYAIMWKSCELPDQWRSAGSENAAPEH